MDWRAFLNGVRRHGIRPSMGALLVGVITLVISLFLPVWYQARTTVLPPEETAESFGILSNLIEASALSKVGLITATSPTDVYTEILKSRRIREPVIQRFHLQERYRAKNLDLCMKAMDEHVRVDVLPSRILRVRVEDKSPRTAADIANALIAELDAFNREIRAQRAGLSRQYLERQLAQATVRLRVAEQRLASYERGHGVVAGERMGAVEGVADMVSRKLALQVRRTWLESVADRRNPALQSIGSELEAIDRELSRLPGLKQEAERLALDVEIQRRVYTLLMAQFEEARLQEQRTIASITVLDTAQPPQVKSRPRRMILVAIATGSALALAGIWTILRTRRDLEAAGLLPS